MMDENRTCIYSSKYGGEWVNGFFHRWIDVKEPDCSTGTRTRALIENKETGRMEIVGIKYVQFMENDNAEK